ncbi:MAG TPA: hypothetical protein PK040_02095 [Anaerolineaceae bacterium]|nr:hypothetical protein [Anaerolineaceae bacterium]
MGLFPLNTNWGPRKAQTDAKVVLNDAMHVVCYSPGNLAVSDDDRFVVSVNMKVGAYTLAVGTMPEAAVARKLLITVTQVGGVNDTMGTLTIVGTDIAGNALSETIAPTANSTKTTVKAFKTVTSITGAGWVRDAGAGTEDTIKIGTSEVIGLPDKLSTTAQVLFASHNQTKEATAPTIVVSSTDLATNSFDLDTALNGSEVKIYYLV